MKRTQSSPESSLAEGTLRKAPVRVGLAVALASAGTVAVLSAVVIAIVWKASRVSTSRPAAIGGGPGSHDPHRSPHGGRWQERVVDLGEVIPLTVLLGVVSVVFVSLIAWWATRRANAPIEQALAIQRAFVADASHELRTPLTTLNSRIQLAQHRLERDGNVGEVLVDLRRDAETLDQILTDLLLAAEPVNSASGAATSASVFDATQAAFRLAQPQAEAAGVHLVSRVDRSAIVRADQTALMRALVALVGNAIAHSPTGATVQVSAGAPSGSGLVNIRVADQGPGIAPAHVERVFERFARLDEGTAETVPSAGRRGFGLGLALVRDIATRFNGTVAVEQTSSIGTIFLLQLPA